MGRRHLGAEPFLTGGVAVLAACSYEFPVRELVVRGKSGERPWLLDLLVPPMVEVVERADLAGYPQVVVPVPLHPVRRRERGFDQAVHLARGVGRVLGLPAPAHALRRRRMTPGQKRADTTERHLAVHGAFGVGPEGRRVEGRRVLLLDDVLTTGATMEAAAAALFEAGCAGILGLVAARTPRRGSQEGPLIPEKAP